MGKSGCIRAKLMYLGKVVLFVQSGCILVKMVVFGQRDFFLGKIGCN